MTAIAWTEGTWSSEPAAVERDGRALIVTAVEGSDAWRQTAYGYSYDTAHALLAPLAVGEAMEVAFTAPWDGQFDQAGLFVRSDAEHWVKAGLECADGHVWLGAVVTDGRSDWSTGVADDWAEAVVTVRVSRWADSLILRARAGKGPWRLMRLAPFDGDATVSAGPFLCAPTRPGFSVTFSRWTRDRADAAIHSA